MALGQTPQRSTQKFEGWNHALELKLQVIRAMGEPVVITNSRHLIAFANPAAEAVPKV